uniref:Uncharacterized protein n=1 Tax=Podoviridae sp. ct8Lf7 TaxID=2827723 RepID=A0A8S5S0S6_9CAUD|nr:MAG TPA: hypothetical protein [Podoviridae sp. ct8Lf7]
MPKGVIVCVKISISFPVSTPSIYMAKLAAVPSVARSCINYYMVTWSDK